MKHDKPKDYSKIILHDVRPLLWIVTIGSILLAFYCVYKDYLGGLPWIASLCGLPWAAYGTISSFYLNMAKSDHSEGGITYETAKANNFGVEINDQYTYIDDSPQI